MTLSDDEARMMLTDAIRSVEDYYKRRGIFQDRFGFGAKPAIVVVDFAYGWTDEAYAGGSSRLDRPVECTRRGPAAQGADHLHDEPLSSALRRPAVQISSRSFVRVPRLGRTGLPA